MNYSVEIDATQAYPIIYLKSKEGFFAHIYCFGALLNAFGIDNANGKVNVIDGYESVNDAINEQGTWFKNALLCPFAGRLENGKYSFENKEYIIKKFYLGENALHGFMYDAVFDITEYAADANECSVTLTTAYKGSDKGYPFEFTLEVKYCLCDATIFTETTVKHENEFDIPFALGWHPYFNLEGNINECTLQICSNQRAIHKTNQIPTGDFVNDERFIKPIKLNGIELDDCFVINTQQQNNEYSAVLSNNSLKLEVDCLGNSYPYVQIFTPDHRNNIAIEPLTALPNSLNTSSAVNYWPYKSKTFTHSYKLTQL